MKTMMCIIGGLVLSPVMFAQSSPTISDLSTPLTDGQRGLNFSISHTGIDANTLKTTVYYSTDPTQLNNLNNAQLSRGLGIIRKNTSASSDVTFIFPHEDRPSGPNRDLLLLLRSKNISVVEHSNVITQAVMPTQSSPIDINPVIYKKGACVYYRIKVSATNRPDFLSDTKSFRMPDTYNIGLAGDSYGAGEGAPNRDFSIVNSSQEIWTHNDCHRSNNSGLVRGVKRFIHDNPEIAVDYMHVACSGAMVSNLTIDAQHTGLAGFNSPHPIQFDILKNEFIQARGHDKLHLLLMSIGGNNAGFGQYVVNYMLTWGNAVNDSVALKQTIQNNLLGLTAAYGELNEEIRENFPYAKVGISTYPDPTKGVRGTCGLANNALDFASIYACCMGDVNSEVGSIFNPVAEYEFTSRQFVASLNRNIRENAARHNWNVIEVENDMGNHGICNCDAPFINRWEMSLGAQGDVFGVAHPNVAGYRAVYAPKVSLNIDNNYRDFEAKANFAILLLAITDPGNPLIPKPCNATNLSGLLPNFAGKFIGQKVKNLKISWANNFLSDKEVLSTLAKGDENTLKNLSAYKSLMENKVQIQNFVTQTFPKAGKGSQNLAALKTPAKIVEEMQKASNSLKTAEIKQLIDKDKKEAESLKIDFLADDLDKLYNRK